jgi:hypothetical protein
VALAQRLSQGVALVGNVPLLLWLFTSPHSALFLASRRPRRLSVSATAAYKLSRKRTVVRRWRHYFEGYMRRIQRSKAIVLMIANETYSRRLKNCRHDRHATTANRTVTLHIETE